MRLSLIAAVAANRVIGRDGGLPWHLSGDLKFFKAMTMGKPLIMGRKTFESIGRPLPGRPNVVISRNPDFRPAGAYLAADLQEALAVAGRLAGETGAEEAMVIGGAQIYAQTLPTADRLYLTEVDLNPDGDTLFPAIDRQEWREVDREEHRSEDGIVYSFVILDRAAA